MYQALKSNFKILDRYIIKKFLGTFLYTLMLIILVTIIFDISEKIDDFLERHAPLNKIIFNYYLNFIPYFVNLFSPLFVFISVIFFTSRMASQTEIVAIMNSGVSFNRLMRPYIITATFISCFSFYLNNWVIPHSNKTRLEFENVYIKSPYQLRQRNIHRQIKPGEFIYFESYNNSEKTGYLFSLEKFNKGQLTFKLLSDRIVWDSTKTKWRIENYFIRRINGGKEKIEKGVSIDTAFSFRPEEFNKRLEIVQAMDMQELNRFIAEEKMRGSENISSYEVEKYMRTSYPLATFILTIIGVSLSSKKVRGGIGFQIGAGVLLSFTYIMFMKLTTTFATNGSTPAIIAVWIPNIIYSVIAYFLIRQAPK